MLFCKYFGWRHDAGLMPVVNSDKSHHQRNQCFTTTHIALQQTIHLAARFHVCTDFFDDAFLRIGKFEWQMIVKETIKVISNRIENDASIAELSVFYIAKYIELYVEKFFKFEA